MNLYKIFKTIKKATTSPQKKDIMLWIKLTIYQLQSQSTFRINKKRGFKMWNKKSKNWGGICLKEMS